MLRLRLILLAMLLLAGAGRPAVAAPPAGHAMAGHAMPDHAMPDHAMPGHEHRRAVTDADCCAGGACCAVAPASAPVTGARLAIAGVPFARLAAPAPVGRDAALDPPPPRG